MDKTLKTEVLNNKEDLVEGTFCYLLFENGVFNKSLLVKFIGNASSYLLRNAYASEVTDFIKMAGYMYQSIFLISQ